MLDAEREAALLFLRTIFPEIPDGCAILIWTLKDRRSHWATSHEQAVDEEQRQMGPSLSGAQAAAAVSEVVEEDLRLAVGEAEAAAVPGWKVTWKNRKDGPRVLLVRREKPAKAKR
jgi:hypothetical protein